MFGFILLILMIAILSVVEEKYKTYRIKHKQTTYIYCKCGNELCSSNSFISDTYDKKDNNHVIYKCSKCGAKHDYNFDIAPMPISWEHIKKGV